MKVWQKRALRTFLQAMLGTLSMQIITYQGQEFNGTIWIAVISSAIAAGISAAMNLKEEEK